MNRSTNGFCQGLRGALRTSSMPTVRIAFELFDRRSHRDRAKDTWVRCPKGKASTISCGRPLSRRIRRNAELENFPSRMYQDNQNIRSIGSASCCANEFEQLSKEPFRRFLVPLSLNQDIEDLAVLSNGTPPINQSPIHLAKDFIKVPSVATLCCRARGRREYSAPNLSVQNRTAS